MPQPKSTPTELSLSQVEECLPPWMQAMRSAARAEVKPEDIREIVQSQVKRAKDGDQKAIKFVFEQLLGGAELKGATFIQNNYMGGERPDKPTKAKPGSKSKIDVIARRISAGNGAFHPADGEEPDLS
jgi:hypothetical protein